MPIRQSINCTTGEVTEVEITAEEIAAAEAAAAAADENFTQIRASRDQRLAGSDWTQGPDSPLTDAKKAKWVTYRQELRDYPSTASKVSELPAWPTEPS
mgnify:FL=1